LDLRKYRIDPIHPGVVLPIFLVTPARKAGRGDPSAQRDLDRAPQAVSPSPAPGVGVEGGQE